MSNAWETTVEDVQTVLKAHNIEIDENHALNVLDKLDQNAIEKGVLHYSTMEGQTASMLSDIEDQLMKLGTINETNKKFHNIQEDD